MTKPTKWLAAATAAAAGVAIYATLIEPRWIQVTRPRIHIGGLHPALEGLRIALLTDLHAGGGTPLSLVRRAVRLTMAERPHLIALTGDFADDDAPSFRPVLKALQDLNAPLGVYAVPGNHDFAVGIGRWHQEVTEQAGITDLTNRMRMLDVDGARLCVGGVDDLNEGHPTLEPLPTPDQRDFAVLLAHTPDHAEKLRGSENAVDLVLAGHTHGGQVRLPFAGAMIKSVKHDELYEAGLRRRPWTQVYTSRGLGTIHLPVRFLCRPEVAVIHLTRAERSLQN
jgi:predicted MPP superfamily phosphohydrolase